MRDEEFNTIFQQLTGYPPLSWQTRLYRDHFLKGELPSIIDLPTGLGKTMVMAIWLIAWNENHNLPRRLIYVVDRRTVVDQATDIAIKLQKRHGKEKLPISTLRGQLADNREWSRDPSKPAIIIGTVDLIGSALLFSGYRSGFKTKPLHAGLLGQDSLLVLDEAHLSKPFEKLVKSITTFQKSNDKPMRVIRMSATSADEDTGRFKLEGSDLDDKVIEERFTAKKRLTIETLGQRDDVKKKLVGAAIELAQQPVLVGKRIVVFVRRPDDATRIATALREHVIESVDESGPKPKKVKERPYFDSVEVLTGTMRGLERDELVETPVFKRFLDGDEVPGENGNPVFLVSTSAGEVGFDLNADHLVGDDAPLDSWIQRLGRVNRRGKGTANVLVFAKPSVGKKKEAESGKHTIDSASAHAIEALKQLPKAEPLDADKRRGPILDASPCALQNMAKPENAISPSPVTVDLTDILLDAWSMTSITEPMPGRPAVAPWLRGIAEDLPETTIAWRVELDLPGFAELDIDTIKEWLDTHRILTHETLSVPTNIAAKWFLDRWNEFPDAEKSAITDKLVIIDRAGFKAITVRELIDQLSRKSGDTTTNLRNADIVIPASFGGIERKVGLLDISAPKRPEDAKDVDSAARYETANVRRIVPDVADDRGRYREVVTKLEDGKTIEISLGSGTKPTNLKLHLRYAIDLESDDDKRVQLVSYIPRREKPEYGTSKPETLASHVGKVRIAVDSIVEQFRRFNSILLSDGIVKAAQLAADWHDHGKDRERWQRLLIFPRGFVAPDEPMGKSGGEMRRDSRGYRHEFGSLRQFTDAFNTGKLLDDAGNPIGQEVFDLAMHMIATHHGRGRPHFDKGGFDPDDELRSDEIHANSIRRFARLQKQCGHWRLAWLENLLRCADAIASSAAEEVKSEDVA